MWENQLESCTDIAQAQRCINKFLCFCQHFAKHTNLDGKEEIKMVRKKIHEESRVVLPLFIFSSVFYLPVNLPSYHIKHTYKVKSILQLLSIRFSHVSLSNGKMYKGKCSGRKGKAVLCARIPYCLVYSQETDFIHEWTQFFNPIITLQQLLRIIFTQFSPTCILTFNFYRFIFVAFLHALIHLLSFPARLLACTSKFHDANNETMENGKEIYV